MHLVRLPFSKRIVTPQLSVLSSFQGFTSFQPSERLADAKIKKQSHSVCFMSSSSRNSRGQPLADYLKSKKFSTNPQNLEFDNNNTHLSFSNQANSNNHVFDLGEDDVDPNTNKTSILMEVGDKPGALHETLRYFWKYDINITRIESRPSTKRHRADKFDIFIDFDGSRGERNVDRLLYSLHDKMHSILVLDKKEVPWFPRHVSQLDIIANRVLDAGIDLMSDHPGFNDPVYRERRGMLADVALNYKQGEPVPYIKYTDDEIRTWGAVFDKQEKLLQKFACKEFLEILPLMKKHCGYSNDNIPQQEDISRFLQRRTGFRLRPVAGLLSSRDFLNGLAFRIFFSTQYIRHHSKPLYTPEPDICHELLGHAPMFADRDFADFSQEIGLASLGASDEDIQKLARCYWFSVEFGLCKQRGELKAYGAGLLSSFGELEYACAPYRPAGGTDEKPKFLPWDPLVADKTEFPITTYQPTYFVAESLMDAKERMRSYCEDLARPFFAKYNPLTQSVWVDRAVKVVKDEEQKRLDAENNF